MAVAAMVQSGVHIRRSGGGKAFPEDLHELGIKCTDRGHGEGNVKDNGCASTKIDRYSGQRLVHRNNRVPIATDAAPVSQGLAHTLAQRARNILHRVMTIHVEVTIAAQRKIDQRVTGKQREHVVEEA